MFRMIVFLINILLLVSIGNAQIKAITEDGKTVLLNSDGTWKYSVAKAKKAFNPLSFEVINTKSYGSSMTGVKVKITNTSNKDVRSARVSCIAKSSSGRTIDFKDHYVIKSLEGGLGKGKTTYFEYVLDANRNSFTSVEFQIENITYK